jgi:hypothetical protein
MGNHLKEGYGVYDESFRGTSHVGMEVSAERELGLLVFGLMVVFVGNLGGV